MVKKLHPLIVGVGNILLSMYCEGLLYNQAVLEFSQKACGGKVRPCQVFQLLGISFTFKSLISSLSRSSTSFGMFLDVAQFAAPTQRSMRRKLVGLKYTHCAVVNSTKFSKVAMDD